MSDPKIRLTAVITYFATNMPAAVKCDAVSAEAFAAASADLDSVRTYAPFGYLPPQVINGMWTWLYCPAIVAEQTAQFSDTLFNFYLSIIENRIATHWTQPELNSLEREHLFDQLIYDIEPGSAQRIAQMQISVLDGQIHGGRRTGPPDHRPSDG